MLLKIKKLNTAAVVPAQATSGSAGFDLCACIATPLCIPAGARALVPTGIAFELPEGHVGLLAIRSSMGVRAGITLSNGVGVIDEDYRGEVQVGLINLSGEDYTLQPAQRIAQLVVVPVPALTTEVVDELSDTARGEGGFGSSGK